MNRAPTVIIESREHLIGWLGEAAEIEHNLMCCYLYAMYGLKSSTEEGVSETEFAAMKGWRKVMLDVALEEMNHLTLVGNLTTAIGGSPHFGRPNFPIDAGPYPADLVMELAPFNLDTLEHFIFVERPENQAYPDGSSFAPRGNYDRKPTAGRLMPAAGDTRRPGGIAHNRGATLPLRPFQEQAALRRLPRGRGIHQRLIVRALRFLADRHISHPSSEMEVLSRQHRLVELPEKFVRLAVALVLNQKVN